MKQWITSIILICLLSPLNIGCARRDTLGEQNIGNAREDTLDEQVETIGQHLAWWSHFYHQTIKINGKPVNIEGYNSGGYSTVWWQLPLAMAYGDKELASIKEQNRVVKENLKQILEQSNCNLKEITMYVKQFVDPSMGRTDPQSWNKQAYQSATPERITKELSCLGVFEFKKVFIGIK